MDICCVVCAEPLEWVAYGPCFHREVCSTGVARLRFTCDDRHHCCIRKTDCNLISVTKIDRLLNLLVEEASQAEKCGHLFSLTIVFVERKTRCDEVAEAFVAQGLSATSLHGGRSQNEREAALQNFWSSSTSILVAADVASRGLDVTGVSHVINLDLPKTTEDYIHWIGRTGRAGSTGIATSFYTDRDMFLVTNIRKAIADAESGNVVAFATGKISPIGESRSEAEDITSPKAYGNSMNPTLTPVKDEERISEKVVCSSGFPVYDECVPMVDKTVDVVSKEKQATPQHSSGSKENLLVVTMTGITGFVFAFLAFARSIAFRVTKGVKKEELATRLTETDLSSSSTIKRLSELEEKVEKLELKLNVIPPEKEELLNVAVCRVDVVEAELIAAKKLTISFQIKFYTTYIVTVIKPMCDRWPWHMRRN